MSLDYLEHLRENSARFARVLAHAAPDGPVPTCPDWRVDDLLWHLAEVQWFWGTVVDRDVTDPSAVEPPRRPDDRDGLLSFFDRATSLLQSSLAHTDPAERRWTWAEHDQTAGFIRRRQAHEALIHRIDAELAADAGRAPMDPELCADGVDEALRVMYGGCPSWGRIDPVPGATVRLRADDTADSWLVTLGRFSGTSPEGETYADEPDILVAAEDSGEETAATVEGAVADLDCWLWNRPTAGGLRRSGDRGVLADFEQVTSQPIT